MPVAVTEPSSRIDIVHGLIETARPCSESASAVQAEHAGLALADEVDHVLSALA